MEQPAPTLQSENWFTTCLPSHPGAPFGEVYLCEGAQQDGHRREGDRKHSRHLLIRPAAGSLQPSQSSFWLPHLLTKLEPLGEGFAASQASHGQADGTYYYAEFVVAAADPGIIAMGQAPAVLAVGYARPSPGLAQIARMTDHLPSYPHRQPMHSPSLPGQSSKVLCHHPYPQRPPLPKLCAVHLPTLHRNCPMPYSHCRQNQRHPVTSHHPINAYSHQDQVLCQIHCLTPL